MHIVTTGPRDCESSTIFHTFLGHLFVVVGKDLVVIEGGANGSDQHVYDACEDLGINHKREPADWPGPCDPVRWCKRPHRKQRRGGGTYCPAAGIRRNQRMLDDYDPPMVAALLDRPLSATRGTKDMIHRADREHRCTVEIDVKGSPNECIRKLSAAIAEIL